MTNTSPALLTGPVARRAQRSGPPAVPSVRSAAPAAAPLLDPSAPPVQPAAPTVGELRREQDLAREAVASLADDPTTPSMRQAHQAVTTYLERERAAFRERCADGHARDALRVQQELVSEALVAVLDAPPARDVLIEHALALRHVLLRHISVSRQLLDRLPGSLADRTGPGPGRG